MLKLIFVKRVGKHIYTGNYRPEILLLSKSKVQEFRFSSAPVWQPAAQGQ